MYVELLSIDTTMDGVDPNRRIRPWSARTVISCFIVRVSQRAQKCQAPRYEATLIVVNL